MTHTAPTHNYVYTHVHVQKHWNVPSNNNRECNTHVMLSTPDTHTTFCVSLHKFLVPQEEYAHEQVRRLSRCLSQDSPSASVLNGSLESLEDQEEEEQMRGSLHFSLYYDQLQAQLVVTVLEARELPLRDFRHSVNPFVHVRLLWVREAENEEEEEDDEEEEERRRKEKSFGTPQPMQCVLQEWQSRLVQNSSNPAFGDQFSCAVPEEDVLRITVKLEVGTARKLRKLPTHTKCHFPLLNCYRARKCMCAILLLP